MANRKNGTNTEGRDFRGRFAKGNSGRPRGARHKATRAVEAMLQGEAEALSRKAIDLALAGDVTALRLCLERIAPRRSEPLVALELPRIKSAADLVPAVAAVLDAVASGEASPSEAQKLASMVADAARAVEVTELERRLTELEARIK